MGLTAVLDRSRTIAPSGYDRWRVPPAALSILMAIGQLYAFRALELPLSDAFGIGHPIPGEWRLTMVGWLLPTAIAGLAFGGGAFGSWVERAGPRKALLASAACFAIGLLTVAGGVALRQIALAYVGFALAGVGGGIGFVAPTSLLIRWFPEKPGLVTGVVISGFGFGAMVGSQLLATLLERITGPVQAGLPLVLAVMAAVAFAFMMFGVATIRMPHDRWTPPSFTAARRAQTTGAELWAPKVGTPAGRSDIERRPVAKDVHVAVAVRTPPFWTLWLALVLIALCGSAILGEATLLVLDAFPTIMREPSAARFVPLVTLAATTGGVAWSLGCDAVGRRQTWTLLAAIGAGACALAPALALSRSVMPFALVIALSAASAGGALATLPTYARDLFGNMHVGPILGRLLSAWAVGLIAGPMLLNTVRAYYIDHGVSRTGAAAASLYVLASVFAAALIANWFVRPVDPRHHHAPSADDDATAVEGR